MSIGLVILLLFLSTYRVTRLMTRDRLPLIAIPRERFVRRWGVWDEPEEMRGRPIDPRGTNIFMRSVAYLWECDWCMSMWTGGILTAITAQIVSIPLPVLVWLASSAFAGWVASSAEKSEDDGDEDE